METNQNIPLVSVALATYNGETHLVHQLDSLVNQTYQNTEIIVSDDGSSDGTWAILENYAARYPNVSVYRNDTPHGIKRNFENALKYCKADYICFCDQDDIWLPQKIERLLNHIGDYALIYHDSLFTDEAGNSLGETFTTKMKGYTGQDSRVFLLGNNVSGHALLFKKTLLKDMLPFPEARYHDWWTAFLAADRGGVKYLDEILVHYRQHEKSQTDFLKLKGNPFSIEQIKKDEADWYDTCARIPGTHQQFYKAWAKAVKEKKAFKIFSLAFGARKQLFYMLKKSPRSIFFRILKISRGK